jgi:beta-N-acetylhexosaminidase
VIFEPLDSVYPATMSRAVLHGLLREKMGYDGMIVTDDIEMRAIADNYGVEDTVVRGLNAGVDHFLCCHTAEVAHRAIEAVIHAVEKGTVSRETLATANRRIQTFTDRYAHPALPANADLSVLRSEAHLALVDRIARSVASGLTDIGTDPTEVMERIRVENANRPAPPPSE